MLNNILPQGDRTVTMVISNILDAMVTSPSNAVLTIKDTTFSPGQLEFADHEFLCEQRRRIGRDYGDPHRWIFRLGIGVLLHNANHRNPGLNYISVSNNVAFSDGQTNRTFYGSAD